MIFCLISNVSECMIVLFVILQIPVDRPLKPGQFSLNTMNVKCILSQKYIGAHRVPPSIPKMEVTMTHRLLFWKANVLK